MPYEPIVPEGQHLGTSREVDGAVTGHLFEDGTNELKGHAAWRQVDDPEENYSSADEHERPHRLTQEERERAEQLAVLIVAAVVGVGAAIAAPHVKRWWSEKAAPTVRSAWKRVISAHKTDSQVAIATSSSLEHPTFEASAAELEVRVMEPEVSMSRAEWEHRFRAMLAAGAFQEEQRRILSNARIEDDGAVLEAPTAVEQLAPQQFADRIKLMLEANPSLLNEETAAELMRVFSVPPELLRDQGRVELE